MPRSQTSFATSVFKRTPQDAAVLTLTVALPNYAALGLPILGSVLGERRVNLAVGGGLYRLRLGTDDPVLPADSGA
ncbi:AEC family transporter [Klebsiella pneumoniae]